ncbi:MAG: hypothetical protein AAF909_02245 [Pseudomonadota bacterium]
MSEGGIPAPALFLGAIVLAGAGYFGYAALQSTSLGAPAAARAVAERLDVAPWSNAVTSEPRVASALETLAAAPCDKPAMFQLAAGLERSGAVEEAAEALLGFADSCEDGAGERYRAVNLLFGLGSHGRAATEASALIEAQPLVGQYYFARAQALEAREGEEDGARARRAAALGDYASALALLTSSARAGDGLLEAAARRFSASARHCEAATILALRGGRLSGRLTRLAETFRAAGCGSAYASGEAIAQRRNSAAASIEVRVNGVAGRFLIAPDAPFLTVTPEFAARAQLGGEGPSVMLRDVSPGSAESSEAAVQARAAQARLLRARRVALGDAGEGTAGEAVASDVSVLALERPLAGTPDGADGTLGRSFLARFDVTLGARALRVRSKPPQR